MARIEDVDIKKLDKSKVDTEKLKHSIKEKKKILRDKKTVRK